MYALYLLTSSCTFLLYQSMSSTSPPSSSTAMDATAEAIKAEANEAFLIGDYSKAEALYSNALDVLNSLEKNDDVLKSILYSNRSAARLSLGGKSEDALQDADLAIALNPMYSKGYLRKSNALKSHGDHKGVYNTWIEATKNCEDSPWLKKMVKEARATWDSLMKEVDVLDSSDLLERYSLLQDTRMRLCTLAHFWNYSSPPDRLAYLKAFLELIGGSVGVSEQAEAFEVENMQEMPMYNYEDLPRSIIEPWIAFFESLSADRKVELMRNAWALLTPSEQNLVILDLKTFFGQSNEVKDESEELQ